MNTDNGDLLFETYRLHAELAERVASLREGVTKLFSGMVSGIVTASVLLHRLVPDATTSWILPTLGILVSLAWALSLRSMTDRLSAKHAVLVILETKLPFDFLVRETAEFDNRGFWRRSRTGLVMPAAFLLLCVTWLGSILIASCA